MARVLIVEDESLIAEEIHDRLTRLNYEVVGIEDTAERAWATASATKPDVVLMDIRLKGEVDGIQAAERIRRELDIPSIYLTAHTDADTIDRAKKTAPLGYLLKPFQERDLFVTLEIALHRHQMDGWLRASELKYATTLASIGDGVLATDAEGRVTFLNPVAEQLTQWSSEEALGRPASDVFTVIPEDRLGRINCPPLEALRLGALVRFETPFLLVARDGSTVLIDDCAAPILGARGQVSGAVVAFRDIRERRAMESVLRRTEEQLQRSQRLEALGRLAGGVAHDFNNHLTVISGYSQLLMAEERNDDTRELAGEIYKAATRSASLTHQLLAFSRGQLMAPRVIDLNSLIRSTDQFLQRLIGENIEFTADLSYEPALIRADPGQVEQIVVNLVINARDSMPHGGRLVIGTAVYHTTEDGDHPADLADGHYQVLRVVDTGVGMDAATRARIFEPFFTTKAERHGTGLGLATTYGIVKQSGGAISVESELGHG
ncbi:MAG: response regulator, partial [Gemmatimonadetes bacterium]|nr:response regulator [Gemmatimonadota bacterium]